MRIVCENCAAAYSIAEKIIGPSGRIVKCAKCSHSWKVVPNKSPENENSKSGGSLAPVINTKLRFLVSFLILLLCAVTLLLFSKELVKYKPFKSFYEIFSIYDHQDIKINDCSFVVENNDIQIKGTIVNQSSEDKKMPSIQYMLLDKNKKIVFSYIVGPEKPIIKAGEVVSISGRVENVERPVKYIKVNIGNKLDLLMRS